MHNKRMLLMHPEQAAVAEFRKPICTMKRHGGQDLTEGSSVLASKS